MPQRPMKRSLLLIAFGVGLTWLLLNLNLVLGVLSTGFAVLRPFLLGLSMAFILNILMSVLERWFVPIMPQKIARPLALVLSFVLVLGAILVIILLITPQISQSFVLLTEEIPLYLQSTVSWITTTAAHYSIDLSRLEALQLDWVAIGNTVTTFLQQYGSDVVGSTWSVTSSIATGLVTLFLGLVFSIYILFQKETLGRQFRRLLQAIFPKKFANGFLEQCTTAATIFRSFVTGQLLESIILGTLCFLGMVVFKFPYAPMISCLVGVTALIPVVGPLIGAAVGAFLILIQSPLQACWFVVYLVVLQQLEGNIIYPKVVGKSVGLPGIWVLFAVTVGAGLGGIVGILFAVPTCSFLYSILRKFVHKRLDKPEETAS